MMNDIEKLKLLKEKFPEKFGHCFINESIKILSIYKKKFFVIKTFFNFNI
jgi:hypothetical protein